jgi:hypothetical protein
MSTETVPQESRTQATTSTSINLITGPDERNGRSLENVQAAIPTATRLLTQDLGFSVPALQIFLSDDAAWMTNQYLRVNNLNSGFRAGKMREFSSCDPQAEGGLRAIFLCEGDALYQDRQRVQHVVAHEIWHSAVQYGLGQRACCTDRDFVVGRAPTGVTFYGPNWLLEGSAEMFGSFVTANGNQDQFNRSMQSHLSRVPRDVDLTQLASRGGFNANNGWAISPAAVYVLTNGDFSLLGTYFSQIAAGIPFGRAFEAAFGQDEATFAARFRASVGG